MARGEVFDPREVSVFHCINRCVRSCFLCGCDPLTGIDYDHRKLWIEQRLQFLAALVAGVRLCRWSPLHTLYMLYTIRRELDVDHGANQSHAPSSQ
jgi:hypothetical protein